MFNFGKNEQEKFNKKMNGIIDELKNLSYIEILARTAAFNKQSKFFNIKITSKNESTLEDFVKATGTIVDETIEKVKKEIPKVQDKASKTIDYIRKEACDTCGEIKDYVSIKFDEISTIRKKGDPWKTSDICLFLKVYIKSRNPKTGKYNPEIKKMLSKAYSVEETKLTDKVNYFINEIIYRDKYLEIFESSKCFHLLTRKDLLDFKFRNAKSYEDLEKDNAYKKLTRTDKIMTKQIIRERQRTKI